MMLLVAVPHTVQADRARERDFRSGTGAASERSRWSVRVLVGPVANISTFPRGLSRRNGGAFLPGIDFRDSVALELAGTLRVHPAEWPAMPAVWWLRMGYHTFEVDVGTSLFMEDPPSLPPFPPFEDVQFCTGRHHMIKVSIGATISSDRPFRFEWGGGLVVGFSHYSDLHVSPVGATKVGIETVTARRGILYGFDAEAMLPLGRTGLLLGFSSSLMGFWSGTVLRIETTEDSDFESNTAGIAPLTAGVFFEYRFPS
jgi:hypothetical protein